MDTDCVLGTLLGGAVGDALGMPVDGLSHQNVRTYYRGIKGYRDDEHRRDLSAGQWTALTQRAFALVRALTAPPATGERFAEEENRLDLRRQDRQTEGSSEAAVVAAPLGAWGEKRGATDEAAFELVTTVLGVRYGAVALAAAVGQAFAVQYLLAAAPGSLDGPAFFHTVTEATAQAEAKLGSSRVVSDRLRLLAGHLDAFPLDLQDLCGGTSVAADEAWPFAVAMVARNPTLLEATLLPAVNVGGAASTVGSLVGALVGALHGWAAFPAAWREGLEGRARLEAEAAAFAESLG